MPGLLNADAWLGASRSNEDQLSSLLDNVHGVLFNHLSDLESRRSTLAKQYASAWAQLVSVPRAINDEQRLINTLTERNESVASTVNFQKEQISQLYQVATDLFDKDMALRNSTTSIKRNLMHWFEVILPAEHVLFTPEALEDQFKPGLRMAIRPSQPFEAGDPVVPPIPASPAPREIPVPRPAVPEFAGTLAEKLDTLALFKPRFDFLKNEITGLRSKTDQALARLAPSQDVLVRLKNARESLQYKFKYNSDLVTQLTFKAKHAQQTLHEVSTSLYYHIAERWLWQTLKLYVVMPEIRRIVAGLTMGTSKVGTGQHSGRSAVSDTWHSDSFRVLYK